MNKTCLCVRHSLFGQLAPKNQLLDKEKNTHTIKEIFGTRK